MYRRVKQNLREETALMDFIGTEFLHSQLVKFILKTPHIHILMNCEQQERSRL